MTYPVYTSPIIFSAPMIRALLDSRKTQTRRLITSQWANVKKHFDAGERCLLWVRESWQLHSRAVDIGKVVYRASENASHTEFHRLIPSGLMGKTQPKPFQEGWRPSIHLPRWASRLTLELTDVRIQRLQEISKEDAVAEGIEPVRNERGEVAGWKSYDKDDSPGFYMEAVNSYDSLWESLHGEGSWDANPEIVALSFRVLRQNIDAVIGQGAAS